MTDRSAKPDATPHPAHTLGPMRCPRELADVDLFGPGAQEHWYEAYPILHREAPVVRLPGEGLRPGSDGFILTRYEDVAAVVRDPVRFRPTLGLAIEGLRAQQRPLETLPNVNAMLVSMATLRPDNELYRAHRQELTDPWVGPGASRHAAMITRHADALIDAFIDRAPPPGADLAEVEFISEFARPLPQRVMADVLGFPHADIPRLAEWGTAQVAAFVHGKGHRNVLGADAIAEQFRTLDEFRDYVQALITERRRATRDDMVSWLTQVHYQALDRPLTDIEINGIVYAMVIGGLETTQYAIEEQAQLLCEHPGLVGELQADRERIRPFTEECMRLRSPTQGLSTRVTTQDEVFQGVPVPAGSLLHLRYAAANVDPHEWACPFELDLDRKALTRHLTFSAGPRVCPGAGISRLEQVIAWNRLLDRIEHLEYAPGNTFEHQPGIMLGTLRLQLRFRPRRG